MGEEWWTDRDIETLRLLRDELQQTHKEALKTFTDLSNVAGRLLSVIGTTLTVIIAAAALASDSAHYVHWLTVVGVFAIIVSGIMTVLNHGSRGVSVGAGEYEYKRALGVERKDTTGDSYEYTPADRAPYDEYYYLVTITRSYVLWIDDLVAENDRKAKWIRRAEYLYIGGLLSILAGTLLTLYVV